MVKQEKGYCENTKKPATSDSTDPKILYQKERKRDITTYRQLEIVIYIDV